MNTRGQGGDEVGIPMQVAVEHPDMSEDARLAAYGAVSTSLALRSDHRLGELVDAAVPLGSGIGGKSALLDVDGKPVFVKRVPLTDMERLPKHVRSTANLFGLPTFCQYGVGGPGFGAWRELAVHTMTTNWVLGGQYQGFPMMYHWRVLPDTAALPKNSRTWSGPWPIGEDGRRYAVVSRPFNNPLRASRCSWSTSSDPARVVHRAGTGWRRAC